MHIREGIGVYFWIFLSGKSVPGGMVGDGRECDGVPR